MHCGDTYAKAGVKIFPYSNFKFKLCASHGISAFVLAFSYSELRGWITAVEGLTITAAMVKLVVRSWCLATTSRGRGVQRPAAFHG